MMSVSHTQAISSSSGLADQPALALRLRLKPKGSLAGHVDGSWWPHTSDASLELPALARVLAVRLGGVTRIAFALNAWDTAPRRILAAGHLIRLEGFRSQDANVVHVSGPDRTRISLVVIPPDTTATAAHDAMLAASRRDNTDRPADILAAAGVLPRNRIPQPRPDYDDDDEARWGTDGGRVYERA